MKHILLFSALVVSTALAAGCTTGYNGKGTAKGITTTLAPTGDSSSMPQAPPLKPFPTSPK